jgi:PPK2 family polyphosphate:nucleotide phosphotransferase
VSQGLELDLKKLRVAPGEKLGLDKTDHDGTTSFEGDKKDALKKIEKLKLRLEELQEKLYASHNHKVLIVLQAMDTAGKDSTIRLVFQGVNPQGVRVANFKTPSQDEADHDFLWRIHQQVPKNGEIVIFNRSHYEAVLIVRVHKLVKEEIWRNRYQQINDFERMLSAEGTTILKFYLNISHEEQEKRLKAREEDSNKEWKFSVNDVQESKLWPEYMKAYEDMLAKTSTDWAPWYVVPSNHKWLRDLIVSTVIVHSLEKLHLEYPNLDEKKDTSSP